MKTNSLALKPGIESFTLKQKMTQLKSKKNKAREHVGIVRALGQSGVSLRVFSLITTLTCMLAYNVIGQTPSITSFTPSSGPVGTAVDIIGTNFNATPANNIVFFGATVATVTAATSTQLTVTVPTGATYAPITVLNTTVGLLAYSANNFTPTFTPNKGSITTCDFSPKVDFPAGPSPFLVTVGDLDGDGKADLVVGNNALTISVFRNTSTGVGNMSYAPPVDLALIAFPQSISIGDLDGDGKPDLAVANHQFVNNNASVFRNTSTIGNLSFAARVSFSPAEDPSSVSIGDLDGDGRADMAVTNQGSTSVSIFRNTSAGVGNISYAAKVDFTTGTAPLSVSIGDLDGDLKADLAVVNNGSNTVSIFRNTSTGAGSISYAAKVDFTTGTTPRFVSIGDLDNDGKADLAVVNTGSNTVSVFRNTSTGVGNIGYDTKVDFTTGTGTAPVSVSISDLDGDGKADLAVANSASVSIASLSVFRNTSTGPGNISYATKVDLITGINPRSVSIGDFDSDGKADLAVANSSSNSISVIRNNPNFSGPPTITSFTPTIGPIGTTVTITGTNFSPVPAENVVLFFNNRTATVTASTATSLTVTVPAGTTIGRISVTTNCFTVISATDFTIGVSTLPTITSFTPLSGLVGTTVTITGTNFSTTPTDNIVQFNGTTAVVTASTSTSITTTVPTGATTGKISVTVAGNTATSINDFTVTSSVITITTQPTNSTVCDGTVVTFTTAATGTTNITYQWQIRDSDGDWDNVTDGSGYSGATTPVLMINTSGIFGEGSYRCLVSGDFASDVASNEASLDIAPNAPDIADVVRCGPGVMMVTASGGTNGQYRWYTQASGGTAIPGEVNSTFTTPFLTSTTLYYVAINNGTCESPRSDVQVGISTCQPQPGFVWGQGMGVGTMANGSNSGGTILIDADGNLLVCGGFQGTIDFDNGPGIVNLTAGSTDAFLLKMTPSGTLLWAKGIGGPGSGNDSPGEMSIDGTGNIYMFFTFNGTADFDPGPAVASLTSTPSTPVNKSDLAVAKYDRDGNFIWVRRIGGNNDEGAGGLKADAAGNVYITGLFRGTTNFNGSFPLTALGAGSTDVLFAKLDTNGTFLWAGNIGSPLATASNLFSDRGIDIDLDGLGNVYVSGRVHGPSTTIDFDPGTGTAPQPIVSDNVAFLLKLNNSGVYQNHYIVEGAAGNEVSLDASGNIYFTGAFTGTVDIDPGPGVFNVTGAGANYITKLNSSGNFVWGKVLEPSGFGTNPSVLIGGIVFDAAGDLHVTGYITTTTDFDLGSLVESRGLNGFFVLNSFIWKLNTNGDFNWVLNMRRISGSFATASYASVAVSATGDVFATGSYARNVDLDPGLCEFGVTNVNGSNIFISQLSPTQPNVCFAQQPTSVSACDNDIVTFTTGIAETGGIFYQWQKLNTTTSQFENISNVGGYSGTTTATLTINTAGNFGAGEYRCKVSGNTTVSGFSNPATLSLVSTAAITITGATGCSGANLTLTASGGTNGQYRWYTTSTGGTSIPGEVNDTYTTPVLSSTTTYYVSINNGTCESARTPVTATVINISPPTASGASACSGSTVTITASGGTDGQYRWYTVPTGGIAISGAVNSAYTTPALTTTTDYYVSIANGTCEGARTPVVATINSTPAKPTITSSIPSSGNTVSVCSTNVLTLSAPAGFSTYAWSPGGNTQQITASINGNYSVIVTDASGCSSVASDVLIVTVIPAPCNNQPPVITAASGSTGIEGRVSLDLLSLITDADNNIDIQSLKIKIQPASGANAVITASGVLELDYLGLSFAGTDVLTIEVCDVLVDCAQQEIKIEVIGDLNIYNGISSNGDFLNDTWIIQYINVLNETKNNKVTIYSRWGDAVWEGTNYNNQSVVFTGKSNNGNELPSGTYFYKIQFNANRKTTTGYLVIKK